MTERNDGGFTSVPSKKTRQRVYIGNLRISPDLSTKLQYLLQENGFDKIKENDIDICKGKSCYAMVAADNVGRLVSKLHGKEFDGRKLVVQKEQKRSNSSKPSFGGGWSKPAKMDQEASPQPATMMDNGAVPGGDSDDIQDEEHQDEITLDDFRSRCQKPLSELMEEFGERDEDFKKVIPTTTTTSNNTSAVDAEKPTTTNNRLAVRGKASIHVQFSSFGFVYGAPSSRQSWSHAHPLPLLDCRGLAPVPPHMQHRYDGKSTLVKKTLLMEGDELRSMSTFLANQAFDALCEAVQDGHGPAMPLRVTIECGSEFGRHRSVVVCEEAAKSLRTLLRKNHENRISQDISVDTRHVHMDRAKKDGQSNWSNKPDDEW